MTVRTYASPQAFKQALEQRLKAASNSGVDFARRRQLLVFDRFLARVVAVFGDAALLKGGLVLELRLERERTRIRCYPQTICRRSERRIRTPPLACRARISARLGQLW